MKEKINEMVELFSSESHGSSSFDKEALFVRGNSDSVYVPWTFLKKNIPELNDVNDLLSEGYVYSGQDFLESSGFEKWYQKQFGRKLSQKEIKPIGIVHLPDSKKIFEAVEIVSQVYHILKESKVLINGKNLPIQLGEWYAKIVFGLHQIKSTSQRGFDFELMDKKKVEVKIHWQDVTSPKGVKIKKSLLELSDYCVVMYVAKNFMIRDILLLDSDFVLRKFGTKGHTIFLKDSDVSGYFFSKSDKHFDKVINKTALLKFATPNFAMKLDGRLK